jgi:hypothetical protein
MYVAGPREYISAGSAEEEKEKTQSSSLSESLPEGATIEDCGSLASLSVFGDWLRDYNCSFSRPPNLSTLLAAGLLRVRQKDGKFRPLMANRVQLEYERNRGRQNIVLKARQMGISTWVAGRMFLRTIFQPGTLSVQVAHNQTAAEEIFRIVQRFHRNLPKDLREGILRTERNNRRQLVFRQLDSEYRVESAADSNAGRGLTIQNLHCSEVARWPRDAAGTLAGLRAALAPDGELVLESTPMGAQGCFYDVWTESGSAAQGIVRHFFPWWWEAAYVGASVAPEMLTVEEQVLTAREGLSPNQIGFRRQLQRQFAGIAAQEFAEDAESCFLSSGDCVFDAAVIEQLLRAAQPPLSKTENGALWTWFKPCQGRRYILGVDPAGGGSDGDFSAVQVVDIDTGLQCAEWQAHMPVRETAQVVRRMAALYNGALIAVERNNHGSGLLAHLEGDGVTVYEQNGIPGWPTTSWTRPAMVERVGMALMEPVFHSERLLRECRTFVRQHNGKAAAAAGCHDDCVMAMAVALSVREQVLQNACKRAKH